MRGICGAWRVLSPRDLRCEGDLRDVEGVVAEGFEVCGGFRDVEGRFFIGIGGLRGVGGVVAYGFGV